MKALIVSLFLWLTLTCSAQAQGLIGVAPEGADPKVYYDSQRKLAKRLELERSNLLHKGLTDLRLRAEYGSIVWKLGLTYESLCRWQDALAAYNTLEDLKLPPNAMSHCNGCVTRASDTVIAGDVKRLQSKVNAVESVDHVKFDRNKRLATPRAWTLQQERQLEAMSLKMPLAHGQVMTLEEFLK
ncbi:MAG: hypothetical protein K8F91_01985 [Candidatus Obscuribacterales bacterium]|nr:hypothetical protein [Candidatus Obscuribacterales bacterium]